MKYYKVERQLTFPGEEQKLGMVTANFHLKRDEMQQYFERMKKGEIIEDAPVFDAFYLGSNRVRTEYIEWRIQDVHPTDSDYPSKVYWYISDKCKKLLEEFYIAPDYHFYLTKLALMYKEEKLNYWIFQFPVNPYQNFNLGKSIFYYENYDGSKEFFTVTTKEEFFNSKPLPSYRPKIVLRDNYDLVCSIGKTKNVTAYMHWIVSERLKLRMEEELTGFLFTEIDYEVEIDK